MANVASMKENVSQENENNPKNGEDSMEKDVSGGEEDSNPVDDIPDYDSSSHLPSQTNNDVEDSVVSVKSHQHQQEQHK
jgi:hypothetical protein